jgi:hypothetical protein
MTHSHRCRRRLVLRSSARWRCRSCRSRRPRAAAASWQTPSRPPERPLPQEPPQSHSESKKDKN